MEFYGNDEVDDEFCDSYASHDTSESDFDFDYDEQVDNLDKLELSDEDLDVYAEELNSMNESYMKLYLSKDMVFHTTFISSNLL
jgi:hypothetical protein